MRSLHKITGFELSDVYRRAIKTLLTERLMIGMPQWELAEMIGVNQTTISMWERLEHAPRPELLSAWAEALGYEFKLVKKTSEEVEDVPEDSAVLVSAPAPCHDQ